MSSVSTKLLARKQQADAAADGAVRPDLTTEEISHFCNALGLAPRLLRSSREDITARYDLGPRGAWIIGLIEIGVNSPSALTEALSIGRSLVTAEINRLSQAKLVNGDQSVRDGRRIVLALTAEGRRVSRQLRAAIAEQVTSRLAGHSREEVLACIALLRDFTGIGSIVDWRD